MQIDNPNNRLAPFVEINLDPRGYALKINDDYMRAHNLKLYRDYGGYGIIAPALKGE